MTNDEPTHRNSPIPIIFDDWRTISFAVFLVSGSMALVAMAIYGGMYFYMHSRKSLPVEATSEGTSRRRIESG